MKMTPAQHRQAALDLTRAEREAKAIAQLATTWPGMDLDDAYAVQREVIAMRMAQGARLRGHKVGLTPKTMQRSAGIDEPDYGHPLDDMFRAASVLGNPALGVVWLANRLATLGTTLQPGHVVLAGSFTRPVPVAAGDAIHADFGPLGSVACRFV